VLLSGVGHYTFEVSLTAINGPDAVFTLGFGDKSFFGNALAKQGVGDDEHSWGLRFMAVNRNATYRYPGNKTVLGKWQRGDVITVSAEIKATTNNNSKDNTTNTSKTATLRFAVNKTDLGAVFTNVAFAGGLVPALTINPDVRVQINWGERPLLFPPTGASSVHAWFLEEQRRGPSLPAAALPSMPRKVPSDVKVTLPPVNEGTATSASAPRITAPSTPPASAPKTSPAPAVGVPSGSHPLAAVLTQLASVTDQLAASDMVGIDADATVAALRAQMARLTDKLANLNKK